jgi:hypothetical protein
VAEGRPPDVPATAQENPFLTAETDPYFIEMRRRQRILFGVPLSLAVVAVGELSGAQTPDTPQMTALGLFAVNIPYLAGRLMMIESGNRASLAAAQGSRVTLSLDLLSLVLAVLGTAALFWHFHPVLAILFVVSCAGTVVVDYYVDPEGWKIRTPFFG